MIGQGAWRSGSPLRLAASLTLIALLLAGCTGKDDPIDPAAIEDDAGDDASPTTPAPSPTPKPSPRPSPSPAPSPTPSSGTNATSPPASTSPAPGTVLVEDDFSAALVVGIPEPVGGAGVGVTPARLDIPRAAPGNATLVVTWTSGTPLDASLSVRLVDADGNLIAAGEGPSPISVEIPGEGFMDATDLTGFAYPVTPGASAVLVVHFALSVTYA